MPDPEGGQAPLTPLALPYCGEGRTERRSGGPASQTTAPVTWIEGELQDLEGFSFEGPRGPMA